MFDYFEEPVRDNEGISDKEDKFSLDWQNFNDPNQQSISKSKTSVSDIFNYSKTSENHKQKQKQYSDKQYKHHFYESRNIRDISDIFSANNHPDNSSFRFDREDNQPLPKQNQRYRNLESLLNKAKNNNLDAFYRQIDAEKAYEDKQVFSNYYDFKVYAENLKEEKRRAEARVTQQNEMKRDREAKKRNMFGEEADFGKKQCFGNFLPEEYEQEHFFDYEEPIPDNKKELPTEKFNNFYEGEILEKPDDADQFFNFNQRPSDIKSRQLPKQSEKLQPIRQQRATIFEKTEQDEKLNELLKNFKTMKYNYEEMFQQLKSNNQEHARIKQKFEKLKQDQLMKKSSKSSKKIRSHHSVEHNAPVTHFKGEDIGIERQLSGPPVNDMLYLKLNEKIENMESLLKTAMAEFKEEKQYSNVPHIQHFQMGDTRPNHVHKTSKFKSINSNENLERLNLTQEELQIQRKSSQKHDKFTFYRLSSRNTLADHDRIPSKFHESKRQLKQSITKNLRIPLTSSQPKVKVSESQQNNFYSPLQISLSENNLNPEVSIHYENFQPSQMAGPYFPKQMRHQNKNLKNCLIQKSSLVYESFDFHISAKFTKVDDYLHPIIATVRVSNKCTFDLFDVHTIVYGPQGPGIHTDPNNLFEQQLEKNSHYIFHVYVNKKCLDDNFFSLQISYKTDSMSKKKINIKVILPLIYFIEPSFIYEEQFLEIWNSLSDQLFVRPQNLNTANLRSYEDLKLFLPFIQISDYDEDRLCFGLVFKYPKAHGLFVTKMTCFTNGKAAIQLKIENSSDRKIRQQILDALSYLFLQP